MTKMEKLGEVKSQLNNILNKLETYMFIENITEVRDNKINEEKPEVIVELKQ